MAPTTNNSRLHLAPLELECMKALWPLGEGTVHAIRGRLLPVRPLAYTTVLTVMDRLARKGAVGRAKRSRAYVYRPLVTSDQVRRRALARLLSEYFDDSIETLRAYLGPDGNPARPAGGAALPTPLEPSPRSPFRSNADVGPPPAAETTAASRPAPPAEIDPSLL